MPANIRIIPMILPERWSVQVAVADRRRPLLSDLTGNSRPGATATPYAASPWELRHGDQWL